MTLSPFLFPVLLYSETMGVTRRKKRRSRKRRPAAPEIHPRGLEVFRGALHLGFANGTGVAVYADSPDEPFVLYDFADPLYREYWGGCYGLDRVLDMFTDKLSSAGCEWLIPVLQEMKESGGFRPEPIIEAYRRRYGQDPVR